MATESHSAASCSCTHPETCVDRHHGRYLTTIYWPTLEGERARTSEVSGRLDVSPASVTEMFERLAADGLLDYEKHDSVALTRRGEEVARELAWRQCVVRTFFGSEVDAALSPETGYRIGFILPRGGIERFQEYAGVGRCCREPDRDASAYPLGTQIN